MKGKEKIGNIVAEKIYAVGVARDKTGKITKVYKPGIFEDDVYINGVKHARVKWTSHTKSVRFKGQKYVYKDFLPSCVFMFQSQEELKRWKNQNNLK